MNILIKAVACSYVLLIGFAAAGRAADTNTFITGMTPNPDELFAPLLADPRELQFALRMAYPRKDVTKAEVAIGHYYGIYRWALPGSAGAMQVNIGGGIFPRFDFSYDKNLQVIDFYGNIPFDIRIGKWSNRTMVYHVSSHLGDDYIRSTGQLGANNSWNSLRSILSYDAYPLLRLYGGYTYNLLYVPGAQKLQAYQYGFEINTRAFSNGRAKAYWANDMQLWERTAWAPMFNSQLGIKVGQNPLTGRGVSYFLEYTAGPEYYGQFFMSEETRVTIGAKFDIN